mmetsp:Transcript_24057/g.65877  ORF Transcript_24057/g.65877 Transcript_24057/m.65877 type:complete len:108 (-) Transcript_24057:348-671(-)
MCHKKVDSGTILAVSLPQHYSLELQSIKVTAYNAEIKHTVKNIIRSTRARSTKQCKQSLHGTIRFKDTFKHEQSQSMRPEGNGKIYHPLSTSTHKQMVFARYQRLPM